MSEPQHVYTVEGGYAARGISILGVYDWAKHAEESIPSHMKTLIEQYGCPSVIMFEKTVVSESSVTWSDARNGIYFHIKRWAVKSA